MKQGQSLYRLWRYQPHEFRRYERTMSERRFEVDDSAASFVVDPLGAVVFVGLSRILDIELNSATIDLDLVGECHQPGTVYDYRFERDERFEDYEGRLVIEWGPGARSWHQRAHRQPKPILEIRREVSDVEWPGYMEVMLTEREVSSVAPNWKAKLSAANGVYLLTCPETGEQYIGAAYGGEGFLGRWRNYAADSHGGNKLLRLRAKQTSAPLQISILEVFGSVMTEDEAFAAESRWKRSLGSRAHGLNAN